METTMQKVDRLWSDFRRLQPLQEEYQRRLDRKVRLEITYNSNHIEGNTLTYGETELLLIFDKTTGNHELREYEEMKAHDVALQMIREWSEDRERPITEMAVKNLHKIMLVRPFWKEAITPDGQPTRRLIEVGDYKKYPNSVRLQNGEIFDYTSPAETPARMGELIEWFRSEDERGQLHPVELAALLHYKFVRIHPFDDGNGRMSRLLMNYVLLRHNLPPAVIKSEDKRNYLFALNQADAGDLHAFVEYIARQVVWSLELAIKAGRGDALEEEDDLQKEITVWKRGAVTQKVSGLHKNDELVYELYSNGEFKNMFQSFIDNHRPFMDMFRNVRVYGYKNNGSNGDLEWLDQTMVDAVLTAQPGFYDPGEAPEVVETKDTFQNIWVSVGLNEYKFSEKTPFSFQSSLIVEFEPYRYRIKDHYRTFLEKNYSDYPTTEERSKIVREAIAATFADIKKRSSQ
jgi:Fic family protein